MTAVPQVMKSEDEENNMVTRRFKKGSVYDALASTSGLDFSPVMLKAFNEREDTTVKYAESPGKHLDYAKDNESAFFKKESRQDLSDIPLWHSHSSLIPQNKSVIFPVNLKAEQEINDVKCFAIHEKFPSWPLPIPTSSSSFCYNSHSWTGQTDYDYPKEKAIYSRPNKSNQLKTNELQPVLEHTANNNQNSLQSFCFSTKNKRIKNCSLQYPSYNVSADNMATQIDFETFCTPSLPQYFYKEKAYRFVTHFPTEHDVSTMATSSAPNQNDMLSADSNNFLSEYEDMLYHCAEYSIPLTSKHKSINSKLLQLELDTPFLDRLRMENAWQVPPPVVPAGIVHQPQQLQQLQLLGKDLELSSDNGTWMGSIENSCNAQSILKWYGSYSDLSTFSTQLSNRSSVFDSGHSTMPESGRLSPQSSCGSSTPNLILEGPRRAHMVARHGCHQEIVAHSARVKQPERHGSESILYYATDSSRCTDCDPKFEPKDIDSTVCDDAKDVPRDLAIPSCQTPNILLPSLSLSKPEFPVYQNKTDKHPFRQDSRTYSSFTSENSYSPARCNFGGNASESSSNVSNITCFSNYKSSDGPKNHKYQKLKTTDNDKVFFKYKQDYEPKPKSVYEASQKESFTESVKRQRASDPDLKAIQKQAVMSFYQRMSVAESVKYELSPVQTTSETETSSPYEQSPSLCPSKLSLMSMKLNKQCNKKNTHQISSQSHLVLSEPHDSVLFNSYTSAIPNLVLLKRPTPPTNAIFKRCNENVDIDAYCNNSDQQGNQNRGYLFEKNETISWNELPNVLRKKKAVQRSQVTSLTDPSENNGSCPRMHYFESHNLQVTDVHNSNKIACVNVMIPECVTLVHTPEQQHKKPEVATIPPLKRRPVPPPPPKQPPKKPPPPSPPVSPPPQVIKNDSENEEKIRELRIDTKALPPSTQQPNSLSSAELSLVLPTFPVLGPSFSPVSPELSLPSLPQAQGFNVISLSDEPLPPPPPLVNGNGQMKTLTSSSSIYPQNSFMSYRNKHKLGKEVFGSVNTEHQSSNTSASFVDLSTLGSNLLESCSTSWERMHKIRQNSTTAIYHSGCSQLENYLCRSTAQNYLLAEECSLKGYQDMSCSPSLEFVCHHSQSSDRTGSLSQFVPYSLASLKRNTSEAPYSFSNCQNAVTKVASAICPDIVVETFNHSFTLNNQTLSNRDYDQNSVQSSNASKINEGDGRNIKSANNKLISRNNTKSREELRCEQLSVDCLKHCEDIALKNLLIPHSYRKTLADYMDGLLGLDQLFINNSLKIENQQKERSYLSIIYDNKYWSYNMQMNDNQSDEEGDFRKRKEQLIESIERKITILQKEQSVLKEEMIENELLGQEIAARLKELAKPNEVEKYFLHVEEMEKILYLLISLSGRLAKAESFLDNCSKRADEKKIFEIKREKLKEQHEDARRLKESIDRRSNHVSTFLRRYFTEDEYANYNRYMKIKTKLIMDIREIDEKINLGEGQLSALNVVAHLWKSAMF